ncbi:MAG TPA: hypothetical protein VGF17_27670, partial [Phytomonospora sp.]
FSEPGQMDYVLRLIAERADGEAAVDALVRAITAGLTGPRDPHDALELTRLRLTLTVPALQAAVLQRLFDAQERLAEALRATRPGELGELESVALVGAVSGAMIAAARGALARELPVAEAVDGALGDIAAALRGNSPGPRRRTAR